MNDEKGKAMKISEERREVARKLRELTVCDGVDAFDIAKALRLEAVSRTEYDTESVRRLADLIEPRERVCRIFQAYGDESEELHHLMEEIACTPEDTVACICQSCGHEFRYERMVRPRYCPNCDARNVAEVD